MFLNVSHTKMPVFSVARQLVKSANLIIRQFPDYEKFALSQQIRKAAVSVYLNIAEGASRKSAAERGRFYEIARGSIVEIDAALDLALDLNYCDGEDMQAISEPLVSCFNQLSNIIKTIHGHQ